MSIDGASHITKDLYKIPKDLAYGELKSEPIARRPSTGLEDFLLEDFSQEQREYIVGQLYPHLK